jgi:hypothetical protein
MFRCAVVLSAFAGALALSGCGPSYVPVNGVVTMDGKPVEGATVTFITEDGTQSASGQTDASGNFSLTAGGKEGVLPGTYKVMVIKTKPTATPEEGGDPAEAMKHYSEDAKAAAKKANAPPPGGMDMKSKMKMNAPGGGAAAAKPGAETRSELPSVYSAAGTTPITVKVPPDNQPVQIELKSKP